MIVTICQKAGVCVIEGYNEDENWNYFASGRFTLLKMDTVTFEEFGKAIRLMVALTEIGVPRFIVEPSPAWLAIGAKSWGQFARAGTHVTVSFQGEIVEIDKMKLARGSGLLVASRSVFEGDLSDAALGGAVAESLSNG